MKTKKQTILSAIQPNSVPHLGNYLGAIRNWLNFQDQYECFFFAVDLHALTQPYDAVSFPEQVYQAFAYYLACGLDPKKSVMFLQSHVHEHAEMAWLLTCSAYMGELSRMTQYKDKSLKGGKNIPAGLFCYPVLMAADILLYQADLIPVGHDQKQHVELARDLAERVNRRFNTDCLVTPEPWFGSAGLRIMDLQKPDSKMSKSSDNPNGVVFLNDSPKKMAKKIKSAVTDSGQEIEDGPLSPGLKNLMDIYQAFSGQSWQEVHQMFLGKRYGDLKVAVSDMVLDHLLPIQEEADRYLADRAQIDEVLRCGAARAQSRAKEGLGRLREAMGLLHPLAID